MTGSVSVSWPLVEGSIVPTPLQQAAELSAQCEAVFAQPEGSDERCIVTIELPNEVPGLICDPAGSAVHLHSLDAELAGMHSCAVQVSEVCILSTARVCEVSAGSRGGPMSYVCSVRASLSADANSAMYLLEISEPLKTAQVLQLKMQSVEERTRWRITGLGFRRTAAPQREVVGLLFVPLSAGVGKLRTTVSRI